MWSCTRVCVYAYVYFCLNHISYIVSTPVKISLYFEVTMKCFVYVYRKYRRKAFWPLSPCVGKSFIRISDPSTVNKITVFLSKTFSWHKCNHRRYTILLCWNLIRYSIISDMHACSHTHIHIMIYTFPYKTLTHMYACTCTLLTYKHIY